MKVADKKMLLEFSEQSWDWLNN